jgi:Ni,Fe-hydrogenase III small subunit/Pyruvate/2-oxoacid:ferredoxin oxidoreductase delta subunit
LFGLASGKATTAWPREGQSDGQEGVLGMPRYNPDACREGCEECARVCPTQAIEARDAGLAIDYGRCVVCQLCTEVCPTGAMKPSRDWAFGVRDRKDLIWSEHATRSAPPSTPERKAFKRSLHIRHVDAGSCNGCESELQALNNPFYNLHRLGIFFTPSPRFADLLLVTGPVTSAMHEPLKAAYDAMPEPRWIMAVGTCAVSGGISGGNYACGSGLEGVLPVDVYLPIMEALLMFLDRAPQRIGGGQIGV